ncbi:DMT family transporter [Rhodobacter maris]|uniref:EamA-like transporter family protein n=1 Tax=Rhodobacter maris TaxID=446682 RepID=A0A285SGG7_9RHOB|nr:DMT family transporter [Rhodobacter maris]SOC06997.1 EamA-like transporter family protein [Rhodobacter maris]
MLGERLSAWQWLGTGIAVAGVLLVSVDSLTFGAAPLWAYGVTLGAMPVHQSLCIHSLTGAALFGLSALWIGDGLALPMTRSFVPGMVWLVFIATFLAYSVYYTALRLYPAAKVSAAIYLSPRVTMLWARALFDDPLSMVMALGLGVTRIGVFLTARRERP